MQRWPWFAIAFSVYPPLHIAAGNPGQVESGTLALILAIAALGSAGLLALLRLLLGTWLRAGMGVTWFLILFFSYGVLNAAIGQPKGDPDTQVLVTSWADENLHVPQSAAWLLLLAIGWLRLRRFDGLRPHLAASLNFASILLLGFTVVHWHIGRDAQVSGADKAAVHVAARRDAPDIYFIVLDGYARADILKEHYGFDNGSFVGELERLGFQVADRSTANYNWTFHSLPSVLNLDYLPGVVGQFDPGSTDYRLAYRALRDNRAASILRGYGYRYVQLQSTWGGTGSNPFADEFLPCGEGLLRDDYVLSIVEISWLRVFGTRASLDLANCHLRNLQTLAGLPKAPGPKFVVAHFLPPHYPYLFDREGNILRHANLSNQFEFQKQLWEDRDAYLDQLVFMNREIGKVVNKLITDSGRTPVVILLSDHGPNLRDRLSTEQHRRSRLANFSAVLLPGAPSDLIPENVSNVNLFRIVFGHLFDSGLPRLPDRHFMSAFRRPFDFKEMDSEGRPIEPGARPADNM